MLAICGGFQLFGHGYRDTSGVELPGAGVFDVTTVAPGAGWSRCIGDVVAGAAIPGVGAVVGFENHGGRTYLGPSARPFAANSYSKDFTLDTNNVGPRAGLSWSVDPSGRTVVRASVSKMFEPPLLDF